MSSTKTTHLSKTRKKEHLLIEKLRNPKIVAATLALLLILILFLLWLLMKPSSVPTDYGHATKIIVEPEFVFPQPGDKVKLAGPVGVGIYAGRFYVADSSAGKIVVFDRFGGYLFDFPVTSKGQGSVSEEGFPVGIAVSSGRIYVSDVNSGGISIFNSLGRPISNLNPKRSGKGVLGKPGSIFIWNQLYFGGVKIYVTDLALQRFEKMSMDGKVDMLVGSKGSGDGQFQYPNGIAVDANQKIFVCDSNNAKIQVFDSLGKFQFYFPLKKFLPPFPPVNLRLPKGIAVDDHGSVHVADAFLQKVFVFNGDGKLIGSYGDMGSEIGQFNFPNGVAIDGNQIAVADKENGRVSVWRYRY